MSRIINCLKVGRINCHESKKIQKVAHYHIDLASPSPFGIFFHFKTYP